MKDTETKGRNKRGPQTFRFTAELGARLRKLRQGAGLTLDELNHVMGRRPGYHGYLGRLENGKVVFPSLALVADYLRACRASFDDLSPLLGAYTGQQPVREPRADEMVEAVLKPLRGMESVRLGVYDRKQKGRLSPEARVEAAKKQARAAAERRRLDAMMKDEVNRLGVSPTFVVRKAAHDYARMVWKALQMTAPSQRAEAKAANAKGRRKRGRPRKTRAQRLSEARARIRQLAPRVLPARALNQIQRKVTLLYEEMHRLRDMAAGGPVA